MAMPNAPGLMDATALTPPAGVPSAPAPDPNAPPDDGADGEAATPQEEAQMEQFLAQAKLAIYDPKHPDATKSIIQALKGSDPVTALANVALMVVQRVEDAATQGGEQLDPAILLQGGYEVVRDIATFSGEVSKGQGTPTFDDKQIKSAYLKAVDLYRNMKQKSGGIDDGAAKQDWATMMHANASGNLDSVLPGATDAAKELGPDASPAEPAPTQAPGLTRKKKRRR